MIPSENNWQHQEITIDNFPNAGTTGTISKDSTLILHFVDPSVIPMRHSCRRPFPAPAVPAVPAVPPTFGYVEGTPRSPDSARCRSVPHWCRSRPRHHQVDPCWGWKADMGCRRQRRESPEEVTWWKKPARTGSKQLDDIYIYIYMDIYGYIYMDIYIYGYIWIYMDIYGYIYIWIYMVKNIYPQLDGFLNQLMIGRAV